MADEADTQVSQDTSAENTAADSESGEQTTQSDTGTQEESQPSDADTGKADAASTGDKSSGTQDVKQESKPVSRRSAAYRLTQVLKENQELKKQLNKPKQEQDEWGDEPAQDESPPNIAELVAKEVERRLNPVISESSKAADDAEINELFSGEKASERPKYEPAIRKMWGMSQYKDVAASELYKIASFDNAVATATAKAIEEYKKADKEAKDSSASGTSNSNRSGKSGRSVADMSDDEFQRHNELVKAGKA